MQDLANGIGIELQGLMVSSRYMIHSPKYCSSIRLKKYYDVVIFILGVFVDILCELVT